MGDITKQNVKRFDARSNKTSRGKNNIILAVIFVYGFNTQILINGQVCNIWSNCCLLVTLIFSSKRTTFTRNRERRKTGNKQKIVK